MPEHPGHAATDDPPPGARPPRDTGIPPAGEPPDLPTSLRQGCQWIGEALGDLAEAIDQARPDRSLHEVALALHRMGAALERQTGMLERQATALTLQAEATERLVEVLREETGEKK